MGLKEDEEEIFVEYQKMCQKWQFAKIDILQKKYYNEGSLIWEYVKRLWL